MGILGQNDTQYKDACPKISKRDTINYDRNYDRNGV
jgi:hypothetical protein